MSEFFGSAVSSSEIVLTREEHLDQIIAFRKEFELSMFSYIEKYILDGRSLGEVFPVAHRSAVEEVFDNRYVYGHNVLEHIIEYTDLFSNKEKIREGYLEMVSRGEIYPRELQ